MKTGMPGTLEICLCAIGLCSALQSASAGPAEAKVKETPVQMTGTYDKDAADKGSAMNGLFAYSYDKQGNPIPTKTITIRNTGTTTVYPLMRGVNNTASPDDAKTGLYDPFDPVNNEYRGYIGYKSALNPKTNTYYYGLKPKQSVTVRVPLPFWDGGRMHILTEPQYLVPKDGVPNVYSYDPNASVVIAPAEDDSSLTKDGVVLWYHSTVPVGPVNESPDQLLEWTFRDKDYFAKIPTKGVIPKGENVNLVNYDISYVDNLYLPLAIEALDVPLPQPPVRKRQPYGWIGANYTADGLRDKLRTFASSGTANGLGTYFGGKGWPVFNMPDLDDIKIPSGNTIFAESPLAAKVSKYNANWYTLSSGGDTKTPLRYNIGGQGVATSGTLITLSTDPSYTEKIKVLTPGMTVVGYPAGVLAPGTKVVKVNFSSTSTIPTTVVVNPGLQGSEKGANFDFFRPVDDYASNAIAKIWYSWAKYYLDNITPPAQQVVSGTVTADNPTLKFSAAQPLLIQGMTVTGTGLRDPDASKFQGPVIVLSIAEDKKSVLLSQLPKVSASGTFTFLPPQPLQSTPANADLLQNMKFDKDPSDPSRNPLEFSKQVYLIMAALSQVPKDTDVHNVSPYPIQLMVNITGGNFGFMFEPNTKALSPGGIVITSTIRDMLKSVMRGVTDFTKYTDTKVWYPDPSLPRGNQTFNVFNLDPYVWFVHTVLGFSGYGFSLDDDSADVGAGGGTQLLLTIGDRPNGKPGPTTGSVKTPENPNEWTIQTTYGPVQGTGAWDPKNKRPFPVDFSDASNTTPIVITSTNHGLTNGTKVYVVGAKGNTNANTPTSGPNKDKPWTIGNVTVDTFELVGTSGNGTYTGGGRWHLGDLYFITFTGVDIDGVYWRVKGDDAKAGFKGANITGPGVTPGNPIRVVQLGDPGKGELAISGTLLNKNGQVLPAGKNYKWIFSGK